jgi:uncharacterized membrane protein required for colicin V production
MNQTGANPVNHYSEPQTYQLIEEQAKTQFAHAENSTEPHFPIDHSSSYAKILRRLTRR